MKTKNIAYFYKHSPNAEIYGMTNGGYRVEIVEGTDWVNCQHINAVATFAEAHQIAEALPFDYNQFSLRKPDFAEGAIAKGWDVCPPSNKSKGLTRYLGRISINGGEPRGDSSGGEFSDYHTDDTDCEQDTKLAMLQQGYVFDRIEFGPLDDYGKHYVAYVKTNRSLPL